MIEIKEKVINYMKKNNFIGIVLKKEIQSFGWAGCRDVIQGEFIKGIEEIKNKDFQYEIIEVDGIKVFIPESLKNSISSSQEIRIRSNLSFFGVMILSVDIFEK